MRIEFLGTGGYHPSERRQTACLLLPEVGLAFDAGTAAFRLAAKLQHPQLTICLSHAHLDHIIGLTYLLVPMARGELTQVTVYATRRTIDAVKELLFAEPVFPVCPAFVFKALEDHPRISTSLGATVTHWPQPSHPGGSTGFRVEWIDNGTNRSLCYVTDTSVDGSYHDHIHGSDLLIHECYFPDSARDWALKTGHSCVSDVLNLASAARVKRLILVHIDPQLPQDEDLRVPDPSPDSIPCTIGRDGDSIDL